LRAAFVPWFGSVYYPYAYSDIFDYTFWPSGYDPGYWAVAYDDFFDGVSSPTGRRIRDYADAAPLAAETNGAAPDSGYRPGRRYRTASAPVPGRVSPEGATALPRTRQGITPGRSTRSNRPCSRMTSKSVCSPTSRMRPRAPRGLQGVVHDQRGVDAARALAAMVSRLQATLDAVRLVRPRLRRSTLH